MIEIILKSFEDGNIKFKVDFKEEENLNRALRLVEVFNDHLEINKTQLRPIGYRVNGFGTNNPLHTSEDYIEAAVNIARNLDKHNYYTTKSLDINECIHVKLTVDEKMIRMTTIQDELEKAGIFYKPLANDKPVLTSLRDSTELELVFGRLKSMPNHRESAQLCKVKGNGEYFICNVANVGTLTYSIKDNNMIEVDAGLFEFDPKELYKVVIESIKDQINKF